MATLLLVGIGAGDTKRYLVDALRAAGHRLVVVAERLPGWLGGGDDDGGDDEAGGCIGVRLDLADAVSAPDLLSALGRQHAVDGVLTCDEAYVELVAVAARRLGLPGLSPEAAVLCRDKHAMRRRLAEAGVPSARSRLARTRDEARAAAAAIGYPVVVKPRNLGGSIGVARADGPDDLDRLVAVAATATMSRVRALSGFLVEEYLDGPELSVESIVADGVTTVCAITEKALAFAPYFEEVGHVTRGLDSREELDARLVALAGDAHAALGVTSGATHCEVRLTADGPRVVEVGARVGGDRIPYLTRRATGVDLIVAAAAVATGGRPDTTPTASRFAGIRMVYPDRDGVVERIGIAPSATELLDDVGWYARAGDRVALPPRGFLARLGYLVAVADTRTEVVRRLDAAEGLLDIAIGEHDVTAAAVGE